MMLTRLSQSRFFPCLVAVTRWRDAGWSFVECSVIRVWLPCSGAEAEAPGPGPAAVSSMGRGHFSDTSSHCGIPPHDLELDTTFTRM